MNAGEEAEVAESLDATPELLPYLPELLADVHALGSRPAEIWYEFNPLWQMSAKEKAEVGKLNAESSQIYADKALVPPAVLQDGVKKQLIESGQYPGIEQSYTALQSEMQGQGAQDPPL